ncbi:MAG: alpha/beta hydrolase [Novosphingobium sp.]|nr:alpha/beta hydrolase [Novosphingobium sp.]
MSDAERRPEGTFDRRAIPAEAAESRWLAPDGTAIRRIDWTAPTRPPWGSLLFLPGRGDSYEKYLETLAHWYHRGWNVTALDWRGQAGSGRLGIDPVTGHGDFTQWVDDLAAFWGEWRDATPAPHVVVGHSMGGHLVLRALAEGKVDPNAAVLSVPMLGFVAKGLPTALLLMLARVLARMGDPRRPAWKWSEKPGAFPAGRMDLLTHDPARYADESWWRERRPELVMGPASWGWVISAGASIRALERHGVLERVTTPVLILGVEGDRLVNFGAIVRAARRLPHAELVRFGGEAHHEILREMDPVRERALGAIDAFLDRVAPAPSPVPVSAS